ncbi:histone deacetylase HDT2 isoform X2 [Aegilops tauschii subsp. strangulata]|uniref:histone deacetylase HDT2 isoform X2 n=1 Tax=Aegilops tauschii subsp. strangulata TaxID=200361 RepID=UPI001ABD3FDF|nr:histone deacetylase HDT2 isoform X2 [Aegilops tauschii subsp. strangulata]
MEFWGLEVKPNQSVKVSPDDEHFLHLSQGALGEVKKDDKATMFVKIGDQKLAIGTLSTDKFPQIQFDLVFEKEFELSHNSKTSSVFFSGYKVFQPAEGDEMDFDSEDESEEEEEEKIIPALTKENGKPEAKEQKKQVKIDTAAPSKSKAAAKDVGKSKKDDDSDDDDDSDEDDSEDDSGDDGALIPMEDDSDDSEDGDDSSDDSEDSSDEEEEETPKPETGKKRAAGSVLKTPVTDKKAKIATPSGQKTGDKKGAVHVATPHPAKKAGKTPATSEKSPKSGGSVACKSCSKTFNSEGALASHSKAKHEAK